MTVLNKQALRERYSPQPVPKCHICGAEMTVQRMSASRITYGCTGATYDNTGGHYAEGRSIADDHYAQSRVTVVGVSDPEVLALLDELEKEKGYASIYEAEKWHYHGLAESEGERADRAEKALDAAEKRIAELEAREVCVPRISNDEFWLSFNNRIVFCEETYRSAVIKAIEAAGIGVKGE